MVRSLEISSEYQMKVSERLADVVIQPQVGQYGMLEFASYEPISETGYQVAMTELSRWLHR